MIMSRINNIARWKYITPIVGMVLLGISLIAIGIVLLAY